MVHPRAGTEAEPVHSQDLLRDPDVVQSHIYGEKDQAREVVLSCPQVLCKAQAKAAYPLVYRAVVVLLCSYGAALPP